MTKVEYIRASHREVNRKLRVWLEGVRRRLDGRSRVLGWLWRVAAWIIFGVVWVVGWLTFAITLFRDVRFTLHFMECEIGDRSPEDSREYLLGKQREYTRRLSYGSVPVKEQKRIDKTFEYLFARYPAPAEELAPDPAAERHEQVIGGIAEVKTVVDGVAGYTDRKTREDTERQEREAEQLAAAEKRREQHRLRSGFEPHPVDFSPKMSDTQFALLTKHMNEIGVF